MPKVSPPRKVLVLFNPKSGQGDSPLDEFIALLRDKGITVELRELNPQSLDAQLEDLESYDALVAAGGDGTVSSVSYAARFRSVPVLAFPAGTANLIAQNLALPTKPEGLLEILNEGHTVAVDLGELEVKGEQHGFTMLAGAGADATMIKDSEQLKERFGALAYVLSAMRQIKPKHTTFRLVIDGEPREFEGIGVMVANMGMANYRLPITSDISPRDGSFTVILIKAGNALQLIPNLIDSVRAKFHLGDPMFSDNLETLEAREIQVDAVDPFPMQYDGELHVETTPFTARMLPQAIHYFTKVDREELDT